MDSSKNLLEEEIVISKLMGEPRVAVADLYGYVPTEIVIFDGVPVTLRMFLILTINIGSGQDPEKTADEKLSREIEELWDEVGFVRPENTRTYTPPVTYLGTLMAKVLSSPPEQKVDDLSAFKWLQLLITNYQSKNKVADMRQVIDKLLDELRLYRQDQYQRPQ